MPTHDEDLEFTNGSCLLGPYYDSETVLGAFYTVTH